MHDDGEVRAATAIAEPMKRQGLMGATGAPRPTPVRNKQRATRAIQRFCSEAASVAAVYHR